jgi:vacuolar-type H+-ATPase subunit I/STV1
VIIEMSKVRILGPRDRLSDVLRTLQDLSLLHLAAPAAAVGEPLDRVRLAPAQERESRHLRTILGDIDAALAELRPSGAVSGRGVPRAAPAD